MGCIGLMILKRRQIRDYRASDDKVIGQEWRNGKILKGRDGVLLEALFRNLPGNTEKNYVYLPGTTFETSIFLI